MKLDLKVVMVSLGFLVGFGVRFMVPKVVTFNPQGRHFICLASEKPLLITI